MLPTVSLEEAQANLAEIINALGPGEEVVIMKDNQPVAELRLRLNRSRSSAVARACCPFWLRTMSI